MRRPVRCACFALGAPVLISCVDTAPSPLTPTTDPSRPRMDVTSADWIISDLQAEYGGAFSWDTTQTGQSSSVRYDLYPGEEGEFCRDHFRPIDLWWDGGDGIAVIHLDPPLLFRGYRPGTFMDRRRLIWRKAIYETLEPGEGVDPAGNLWRFQGRFNALCRGGSREIGPIVFNSQLLVSQDPIDRPVLVRRGSTGEGGCGGSSGGDTELIAALDYDPYDPVMYEAAAAGGSCTETESGGTQYQPGDYTGGETVDWGTGEGNGGTSVCGNQAMVEYVCIDVYNEETGFWEEWGCGYVTTC